MLARPPAALQLVAVEELVGVGRSVAAAGRTLAAVRLLLVLGAARLRIDAAAAERLVGVRQRVLVVEEVQRLVLGIVAAAAGLLEQKDVDRNAVERAAHRRDEDDAAETAAGADDIAGEVAGKDHLA